MSSFTDFPQNRQQNQMCDVQPSAPQCRADVMEARGRELQDELGPFEGSRDAVKDT